MSNLKRNYISATQSRGTRSFETIDSGSSSTDNGRQPAAITYNSSVYSFYYDAAAADLRVATASFSTSPTWTYQTLDSSGDVGANPSAVVDPTDNTLHVFYYDATTGNKNLKHLSYNGTTWTSPVTLDGAGGSNGRITADVGGQSSATALWGSIQLFYYDATNGDLRHAWANSGAWNFETLDGDANASGGRISSNLGLDPVVIADGGDLQLFYYDATSGNLRHTWTDSSGWHRENLDGDATTNGRLNADLGKNPTAVSHDGNIQLFYYDVDHGNLRHTWADGSGWHFENLEGDKGSITRYDGNTGMTPSAVVVGSDIHVFSYDNNGSLRHAWATATQGWQAERLDGFGDDGSAGRITASVGSDPSAVLYGTTIQVFYYDATNGDVHRASL